MTSYTLEEFNKLSPEERQKVAVNVVMKLDRVKIPRRFRKHRAKVNLVEKSETDPERARAKVTAVMNAALPHPMDWFILYLIGPGDDGKGPALRIGEVIGDHRHGANLPGLQVDDLKDDGIWVRGKMGKMTFIPLTEEIVFKLRWFIGDRKTGMVFNRFEGLVEAPNIFQKQIKQYARRAGLADWKLVTPHRLRAAMAQYQKWVLKRDVGDVQGLMRHAGPATQLAYTGEMPDEERRRLLIGQ